MHQRALDAVDFPELLTRALQQPIDGVRVTKQWERLYSSVWFLDARTARGTLRIVAKHLKSRQEFEKQLRSLQAARDIFVGRSDVCIPYIACSAPEHLLFMPWVSDPSLAELCCLSTQRVADVIRGMHWRRNILDACRQAGNWLREWHAATAGRDDVGAWLEAYLAARKDCLRLIPLQECECLRRLVESVGTDVACATHGDFTPLNVLWSPQRLTVLDFGLSEWDRMSPFWDCASMEVGLERDLRFAWRHLGAWSPTLPAAAIDAFRIGYGSRADSPSRSKLACLAVRHLILFATDVRKGRAYRRRAAWHQMEMRRALAQAV